MAEQKFKQNANIKLRTNIRGVMKVHEALRILAMPAIDLRETIQGYLASNPIIEEKPDKEPDDHLDYSGSDFSVSGSYDPPNIEQLKTEDKTIREILKEDPQLYFEDEVEQEILDYLIGNIDDNGFIICDIYEFAEQSGYSVDEINRIIKIIQETAPAGVGARSAEEAILLCAKRDMGDEEFRIAEAIIKEFYPMLKKRKFGEVAKELKTESEIVYEVWEKLSRYTFSPGANFAPKAHYITPEISIRADGNQISVTPLKNGIPKLSINQEYASMLKETDDKTTREYLKDKMDEANWLIKAIDERRRNIIKIVREVIEIQKPFFFKESENLKPLTLKDVAARVGLATSTVSRAVNSKYILTPSGTFPLKYFFSGGYSNGKDIISTTQVKNLINEITHQSAITDLKR
ncbi:MAG: RNA polymerase factor sigma-54 [Caldisericia bacterium]